MKTTATHTHADGQKCFWDNTLEAWYWSVGPSQVNIRQARFLGMGVLCERDDEEDLVETGDRTEALVGADFPWTPPPAEEAAFIEAPEALPA